MEDAETKRSSKDVILGYVFEYIIYIYIRILLVAGYSYKGYHLFFFRDDYVFSSHKMECPSSVINPIFPNHAWNRKKIVC